MKTNAPHLVADEGGGGVAGCGVDEGGAAACGGDWGGGLIDRETRNVFGVRRKRSPEKFFGGDSGWPAAVGVGGEANKRLNSSIQYEDHLAGTVPNEPVLGMIMFNSYHMQDFVTVEDFGDFPNEMLYTVQEIFFRLHQGLGLDDHANTFSSLLLAKIDKRKLNPLKQIRTIEQLRQ
nr:hypothetical protein [Tanacetum cinerariifolium]